MCEANAFVLRNGEEKLLLESVDLVEPEGEGQIRLVNIFGEQKIIKAKLKSMKHFSCLKWMAEAPMAFFCDNFKQLKCYKSMNLVNHKILFED